jgi:hypothetical protein
MGDVKRRGAVGAAACAALAAVIGCATVFEREAPLVVLDLVPARAALKPDDPAALRRHYDEVLLATCLQGLANRSGPRVFVRYNEGPDDFWFAKMTAEGGWLGGQRVERVSDVRALLARFRHVCKGLAVWDERVPATSNVGVTLAGAEELLAVRYDPSEGSLYRELTSGAGPLPVRRRLLREDGSPLFTGRGAVPGTARASTGSAKCDAYVWLLENVIRKGETNPRLLGYYIDAFWLTCSNVSALQNHTLNNLDYLIANRGAVVDLLVWDDEAPVDDPGQAPGTDLRTLREVLASCVSGTRGRAMIPVFGFPPWAFKYTDFKAPGWSAGGRHGGVETEWRFAEIMTAYNAYMDADALGYSSFPNASLYQHCPVPDIVRQGEAPTRERLIREGVLDAQGRLKPVNYYAFYQGDFDAAAWVYWHFPKVWDDPARGTLPLTWAINPTLAQRFPFGMRYLRETRKPGEAFVAGEGAGYLNPSLLQAPRPEPGLPDALGLWAEHSAAWYRQWDLTVTGFNIDGHTAPFSARAFEAYRTFSPGGVGLQRAPSAFGVCRGVPYLRMMTDLPSNDGRPVDDQTVDAVKAFFEAETPHFVLVRSILQRPSYYAELQKRLKSPGTPPNLLVDLPTLCWLVQAYREDPRNRDEAEGGYASRPRVSATPRRREGLRRRTAADGVGVIEEVGGEAVWAVGAGQSRYLYFDVADDFLGGAAEARVRVIVSCAGAAPARLHVHYDSADAKAALSGAYKGAAPAGAEGDGATLVFELPDARFAGRQNGGGDFRLDAGGQTLRVRAVAVEKR